MWSSAPAFTVSPCAPERRPVALVVIVAVPARVSLYLKLVLFVPEAIATVVIVAVSAVFRKIPPVELVERFTVIVDDAFTGEPADVCSCTVIVFEVIPAVRDWGAVVTASFDAALALTVRVAVSVLPASLAVIVCAPVAVAVQVAPAHEPSGAIVKVVELVTFPRLLLNWSNPVVVYDWEAPIPIVAVFGATVM
jgi:hypothetical protein